MVAERRFISLHAWHDSSITMMAFGEVKYWRGKRLHVLLDTDTKE